MFLRASLAVLTVITVSAGCGCGPLERSEVLDAEVDAGAPDALRDDAGRDDAGVDAGAPDAATDGAVTFDGGFDAGPLPDPLPLSTAGVWSWAALPEFTCANGQRSGVGINPGTGRGVVLYLQGGGACWDETTCFTAPTAQAIAVAYGAGNFAVEPLRALPLFDRSNAQNPFRDATFVFVPYCTGDLHSGTATRTYGTHTVRHVGALNFRGVIRRVQATFPSAPEVALVGTSAGGFGVQLNRASARATWPGMSFPLLADSAQLVDLPQWSALLTAWGTAAPAGCPDCVTHAPSWAAFEAAAGRYGLLAARTDSTLTAFSGLSSSAFGAATDQLLADVFRQPGVDAHAFEVNGSQHGLLRNAPTLRAADGSTLAQWVASWALASPSWTTLP